MVPQRFKSRWVFRSDSATSRADALGERNQLTSNASTWDHIDIDLDQKKEILNSAIKSTQDTPLPKESTIHSPRSGSSELEPSSSSPVCPERMDVSSFVGDKLHGRVQAKWFIYIYIFLIQLYSLNQIPQGFSNPFQLHSQSPLERVSARWPGMAINELGR